MFFLTALLPVLAVRLALRMFRCRPGPWLTLWLIAAVSFCTFLCEDSPWFYCYTGLMTNLTSVIAGFLAAEWYCRYFDGKKTAFAIGCLLLLATAFAKEDMLLFVPLYVGAYWCILRLNGKDRARVRSLAVVYASLAVVVVTLYCWNRWIVPSPFTSNRGGGVQARLDALPRLPASLALRRQSAYAARRNLCPGRGRRLGTATAWPSHCRAEFGFCCCWR